MADEVRLPTEDEIAKLPRWARVAFAIRCARRVQPLFEAAWPNAPKEYAATVERAIKSAEWVLGTTHFNAAAAADAADATGHRAVHAAEDDPNAPDADYAADAAHAAANAARTATAAAATAGIAEFVSEAYAARTTIYAARTAAAAARTAAAAAIAAIHRDFCILKAASKGGRWTYETRPSLESLGPLWLEGEEPDWKEIVRKSERTRDKKGAVGDRQERLVLTAYADESVDDDTLVEGIVKLYRALNKYYVACGGSGLTVDDWHIVPVRAGVPA